MKGKSLFKRWIVNISLIIGIVGLSIYFSTGSGIKVFNSALANNKEIPVHSVDRNDKVVALTINTGFSDQYTGEILDLLNKKGVRATFFTMGSWIDMYRNEAVAIHENGHEIGNNSLTYPHISQISRENLEMEILETDKKIKAVTGKVSNVFRPPYGEYSDKSQRVVNDLEKVSVVWSVDSRECITNKELFLKKVSSGSIILFNNNSKESLEALKYTIESLQSQGYKFETLSDMLYKESYYIDHTGRQKGI
ncbi:MAG: polysaccharide deacetylase family protein [Clostridium sp.]